MLFLLDCFIFLLLLFVYLVCFTVFYLTLFYLSFLAVWLFTLLCFDLSCFVRPTREWPREAGPLCMSWQSRSMVKRRDVLTSYSSIPQLICFRLLVCDLFSVCSAWQVGCPLVGFDMTVAAMWVTCTAVLDCLPCCWRDLLLLFMWILAIWLVG